MKISFVWELVTKVVHECGLCRKRKPLEFVVVDEEGRRYSVCMECRDAVAPRNGNGNEIGKA